MRIEAYIKDLLFDFDKVVIPGFGAFVGEEQFAFINEETQQIHPPTKQISFNNQLQLDDGILISKIEEEQKISKEAAIEAIQHFVEQLSKQLEASENYNIKGLGILTKTDSGNIQFQQDKGINYFVDAYGLQPVDLPERIFSVNDPENLISDETLQNPVDKLAQETPEIENALNENEENLMNSLDEKTLLGVHDRVPHADKEILEPEYISNFEEGNGDETNSYESIEEDTVDVEEAQYKNKVYNNAALEKDYTNSMEEEEDKIASGFDEYVADANENYQIEAENVEVTTGEAKAKKGFSLWLLLFPVLLLMGAGYLLFTLMGKTENPYAKNMTETAQTPSTQIDSKSSNETKNEETIIPKKEEGLSSNSTAALLKTKEEKENLKTTKENSEKATPVKTKTTNSPKQLAKGYYVIISSIPSKKEAQKEAQKWIKKSYPAFVLPGPNNYNRIGIFVGIDRTVAEQKLANYKNEIISSAWILKY